MVNFGGMSQKQIDNWIALLEDAETFNPQYLKYSNSIINSNLTWFQALCVNYALVTEACLVSLDTGLGKTVTACGYCLERLKEDPDQVILFLAIPESLHQIQRDFLEYTGKSVPTITGEFFSVRQMKHLASKNDILIVSYEALYSLPFCNDLTTMLGFGGKVKTIIADEAHHLAGNSLLSSIAEQIFAKIRYKLMLTATPMTTDPSQIIALINMLDNKMFPNGRDFLKKYQIIDYNTFEVVGYNDLDNLTIMISPRFFTKTRDELGLSGTPKIELILVKPNDFQADCALKDVPVILKGVKDSNQTKVLSYYVNKLTREGKKGLVYASRHDNSEMLREILEGKNRVRVLNGDPRNKVNRNRDLIDFRENRVDVMITNLTESLNLDCDYLIFWENTVKAIQLLGRCVRGFTPKDLNIIYILTDNSVELKQFNDNVYRKSKWLQQAVGKDNSVLEKIHAQLSETIL